MRNTRYREKRIDELETERYFLLREINILSAKLNELELWIDMCLSSGQENTEDCIKIRKLYNQIRREFDEANRRLDKIEDELERLYRYSF